MACPVFNAIAASLESRAAQMGVVKLNSRVEFQLEGIGLTVAIDYCIWLKTM